MTEEEVLIVLGGNAPGTKVFVSYLAAKNNPSLKAKLERRKAEVLGFSLRHFVGTLEAVKRNKNNETYILVWTETRDKLESDGEITEGNWRSLNPSLGKLLSLEVIQPFPSHMMAL